MNHIRISQEPVELGRATNPYQDQPGVFAFLYLIQDRPGGSGGTFCHAR